MLKNRRIKILGLPMIRLVLNLLILIVSLNLAACSEPNEPKKTEDQATVTASAANLPAKNAEPPDSKANRAPIPASQPTSLSVFSIKPDDIVLGNINAEIVVIEYFSLTCPACAAYHKNAYQTIKTKYIDTNRIAYIMRELVANKLDLDASALARCSGDKTKYSQFVDVLLSQQQSWASSNKYREILTNIGQLGGVPAEKYANCSNDQKFLDSIINRTKEISTIPNFVGTPNFFVSNSRAATPVMTNPGDILAAIEKALHP